MNIFQCPWPYINKKAVGNLGAARGLSPYLGAGQWAVSSLFHHQHHQEVEATISDIAPLSSTVSITKRPKYVKKKTFKRLPRQPFLPFLDPLPAVDLVPGLEDQIKGEVTEDAANEHEGIEIRKASAAPPTPPAPPNPAKPAKALPEPKQAPQPTDATWSWLTERRSAH